MNRNDALNLFHQYTRKKCLKEDTTMRLKTVAWLTMLCAVLIVGCVASKTKAPSTTTTTHSEAKNTGGVSPPKIPEMSVTSGNQPENYIRRDAAGTIVGQVKIAPLRTDDATTGALMKHLRDWGKNLNAAGMTQLKLELDRAQPTHAIQTNAPLLYAVDYPQRSKNLNKFIEELEAYIQRGGLLFFDNIDPPLELERRGMENWVDASHPLLTTPFSITGLSRDQLPRLLEINGKTAAIIVGQTSGRTARRRNPNVAQATNRAHVSGLADTPEFRRLWVNILAFAISNSPRGKSDLTPER
jgi:hypothetical protein